jgi:molybdenum cofactor cytidylyltransferase
MGQPKLLLEVDGRPIIDWVLAAWGRSNVDHTLIVVRADDAPLLEHCRKFNVHVAAVPAPTESMRGTLEFGLRIIERQFAPAPTDAWLVAPADMPGLPAAAINHLLATYAAAAPRILVPQIGQKCGHPVLLPWSEVPRFRSLAEDCGLDSLVRQSLFQCIRFDDQGLMDDVDTPDDMRRWNRSGS